MKMMAPSPDKRPMQSQGGVGHEKAARRRRILEENGGAERDRTADLVNAIHALSQLSYGPIFSRGVWGAATAAA